MQRPGQSAPGRGGTLLEVTQHSCFTLPLISSQNVYKSWWEALPRFNLHSSVPLFDSLLLFKYLFGCTRALVAEDGILVLCGIRDLVPQLDRTTCVPYIGSL